MTTPNKIKLASLGLFVGLNAMSAAPLVVYDSPNQTGASGACSANTVYQGAAIPGGMNDKIESFYLMKGYGVVFGVNTNNVGDGKCWVAYGGDRYQNMPAALQNNISFIRVFPISTTVQKKGFAGTSNIDLGNAVNSTWYYNWGLTASTTPTTQEYVAMKWGGNSDQSSAITTLKTKPVANLLAYNEPDNTGQANMPDTSAAATKYEELLVCGLRMGSPVVQQDGFNGWLGPFMDEALARGLRVDFLTAHWYAYSTPAGATGSGLATSNMPAKLNALRTRCGPNMNLWLTEYNIRGNTTTDSQKIVDFINASGTWANNTAWMERHSFLQSDPGQDFGTATALNAKGQAYRDSASVNSNYGGTNNLGL